MPETNASEFWARIEPGAKIGLAVIGLVYTLGVLVEMLLLLPYGAASIPFFRLKLIIAGIWFVFPILFCNIVSYSVGTLFGARLVSKLKGWCHQTLHGVIDILYWIFLTSVAIGIVLFGLHVITTSQPGHTFTQTMLSWLKSWQFYVYALFIFWWANSIEVHGKELWQILKPLIAHKNRICVPSGGNLVFDGKTHHRVKLLTQGFGLTLKAVVATGAYAFLFVHTMYVNIPASVGGGKPELVRVHLAPGSASADSTEFAMFLLSDSIWLVAESEESYIFKSRDSIIKSVELNKEYVVACLRLLPQPPSFVNTDTVSIGPPAKESSEGGQIDSPTASNPVIDSTG